MGKRLAVLWIQSRLAIGVATIFDVRGIYEPHWLLPTVNMLFLFVPGWIIAYVSVHGYLVSELIAPPALWWRGHGIRHRQREWYREE